MINSITIGPLTFHFYGLLLGLAAALIFYVIQNKYWNRLKSVDYLILLLSALAGARIVHLISDERHLSVFFNFNEGGLAFYGAILGVFVSLFFITRHRKMSFMNAADTIALYIPIAQAIGRLGNFFNQELYGFPTDLPWKVYIESEKRLQGYESYEYFHPTFLYEIMLNLLLFTFLKFIGYRSKVDGLIFGLYLLGYGSIRILMNFIRIDGLEDSSMILSAVSIFIGVVLVIYVNQFKKLKKS